MAAAFKKYGLETGIWGFQAEAVRGRLILAF
jgi:hypothetical protein